MAEDTTVVDATTASSDDQANELTKEQMEAEINKLKSINSDVIQSRDKAKAKLREFDSAAESEKSDKLLEKEEFKKLYDDLSSKHTNLVNKLRDQDINSILRGSLKEAGVTSVETALQIIDKSDIELNDGGDKILGFQGMVDKLKTSHSILFQEAKPSPTPVVPTEEGAGNGELDITKLDMKNPKDRAKYKEYRKANGLA